MPTNCFCGCDHFRFKDMNLFTKDLFNDETPEQPRSLYYNLCRNCNHKLADHITTVRSKQAE